MIDIAELVDLRLVFHLETRARSSSGWSLNILRYHSSYHLHRWIIEVTKVLILISALLLLRLLSFCGKLCLLFAKITPVIIIIVVIFVIFTSIFGLLRCRCWSFIKIVKAITLVLSFHLWLCDFRLDLGLFYLCCCRWLFCKVIEAIFTPLTFSLVFNRNGFGFNRR